MIIWTVSWRKNSEQIFTCQVFCLCVVNETFIVVPLFQKSSPAQKNLWLRSWTITRKFASVFFFWKIFTCQVFPLCVVNEIFIVVPLFQKSSPAQKNLWLRSWTITRKFASVFFFWKIFTCQVFPLCVVNEIFIVVPLFQKSSPAQKNLWLHSWTITKRIFASVFLACWLLAY